MGESQTVQALMRDIAYLQEQTQPIHDAVINSYMLWSPRCDPTLNWTVPLVAPLPETPDEANPAMTCQACKEARAVAAMERAVSVAEAQGKTS